MDERRAHPRFDIGFGAEIHTATGKIAAATRDLSLGGCRLAAESPLPEGATNLAVDLRVTVDGIQETDFPPLRVRGQIRWTAEGEDDGQPVFLSGMQFEELTDEQAAWLAQVLASHGKSE